MAQAAGFATFLDMVFYYGAYAVYNAAIIAATAYASNALAEANAPEKLLDPNAFNHLFADTLSERVIVYGETGIAGEIVFQQLSEDRKWVRYVIALADNGQSLGHELVKVLIDGDEVTFNPLDLTDGQNEPGNAQGSPYTENMALRFYNGTQVAADPYLVAAHSDWTAAHIGKGVCYVVWSCKLVRDEIYPNGRPEPIFVFRGRRLYDRRKDSTYPGGSGAHRLNNDATWEWSDNLALCAEDYVRGIFMGSPTKRRIAGLGLPADLLDDAWTVSSANVSDVEGWTINGPIKAGADPAEVLKSMADHSGGRILTRKGKIAIIAGFDWPAALTLTSDDLAGGLRLNAFRSWRDIHNVIRGDFRDPEANWEAVETNPIRVSAWVTEDGQELETHLPLPYSSDREDSTRLAKIHLYRERAPRAIDAPYKLRCAQVAEGDFVTVAHSEYGINETYEVVSRALSALGFVTFSLRSYDPGPALVWSGAEAGDPPVYGTIDRLALTPPDAQAFHAVTAPNGWRVLAETQSGTGGSLPALRVIGTPFDEVTDELIDWIHGVVIEARVNGASDWGLVYDGPPGAVGQPLIVGVPPATLYNVSVRYRFGTQYSVNRLVINQTTPSILLAGGPGAGNSIVDSGFRFHNVYWDLTFNTTALSVTESVQTEGGIRTFRGTVAGTPAAATQFSLGQPNAVYYPVVAGDRVEASVYFHTTGASLFRLVLNWLDSAGGLLSQSNVSTASFTGAAFTGGLAGVQRIGGFFTAPANAARAVLGAAGNIVCTGAANPQLTIGLPLIRRASASQTELTPWVLGHEAELGGDVTLSHTSAAIVGQGDLATLDQVDTPQIASEAVEAGQIAPNAVTTIKVQANAITQVSAAYTTAGTDTWEVSPANVQSAVIISQGGPIVINGGCTIDVENASGNRLGDVVCNVEIRRDSTVILSGRSGIFVDDGLGGARHVGLISVSVMDAPVAGTYTYALRLENLAGSTDADASAADRFLVATELKK